MAWFFKKEIRTEEPPEPNKVGEGSLSGEALLLALLGRQGGITKKEALNIPSVKGCVNFAADIVSALPIKLYRERDGKTEEVKSDNRIRLLNDNPGDTLDAVQFWRALIADYYLGKGGYAYINRRGNSIVSLHYVDETAISVNTNNDPVFKDFNFNVYGQKYMPFDFIKLLRNTKNGAAGKGIIEENPLILSVAYNTLIFEESFVKNGGNKKGFVKSENKLSEEAKEELKKAWKGLYGNSNENVVILNKGLDFKEASNTSVEMQLNENKEANSTEICKLFNMSIGAIKGTADTKEFSATVKTGVMPVLRVIECALNRDLLLEREKPFLYYAFDTKELLKGDIKERFEAYKTGIEANVLQIDEARYMEDLPALGLNWIKLGLGSVLYDVDNKTVYTPNTDKFSDLHSAKVSKGDDVIES